jgi:hypothetical protein
MANHIHLDADVPVKTAVKAAGRFSWSQISRRTGGAGKPSWLAICSRSAILMRSAIAGAQILV